MDELKEVQADKRGTEDDVKDELISETAEIPESITARKKESPETRDDKFAKDGDTFDDETELKTAIVPKARDDKVTKDGDTNDDETELKTAIVPKARDDKVTKDGDTNDDETELKTAIVPEARDDKVTKDGDTNDDETELKTAIVPEARDDKVTKDGDTNDDETELKTAIVPEARDDKVTKDGDTNDDETELKTAIVPKARDDKVTKDGDTNDDETELKTAIVPEARDDKVTKDGNTNNDETELKTAIVPEARDDKVTKDGDTNDDETELKTAIVHEARDDKVTKDGDTNDDETELKTATEPKARDDQVTNDGDTNDDETELKTETEPKARGDQVPNDGDNNYGETELKTATKKTDTDCTFDDTDSYDTKDEFCKKVLQKCYTKLVSDMEPIPVLDHFFEIGFLIYEEKKDIMEIQNTSNKNRTIVEKVLTKGGRGYKDMKSCLQRTKQDHLVLHLAKIENQLKQETKFRDVSILQCPGQPQPLEHEQHRQQPIEQPRPQQSTIPTVMKKALIRTYQKSELLSAQFFPLVPNKDLKIHEIYVKPYMKHKGTNVDNYKEIFQHDNQLNTNVYVVGEAGSGKTSFCQKMISTWCRLQSETVENMSDDQEAMTQFDLLFYVSLREAVDENDIEEMIKNQLLDEEYHKQVSEVLKHERCLVILDGLDEWCRKNTKAKLGYNKGIPGRNASDYLTVLTTTRPWKLDAIQLKQTQIGTRIELLGIEETSSRHLIQIMFTYINKDKDKKCHITIEDFLIELAKKNLEHFMAIPVILKQLICLWSSGKDLGQTPTVIYCQMMELLLELAQNRLDKDPAYKQIKDEWVNSEIQLPSCFDGNDTSQKCKPLIFPLSKLAFNAILSKDKESELVFKRTQAERHGMTEYKIDICLKIGILSQSSIIKGGKSQRKLSFLHKSYQEFMAALFIALDPEGCDKHVQRIQQQCTTLSELMEIEHLIKFIGGMCSPDTLCALLSYIKSMENANSYLQNIVKNGLKEGWCCSHDNNEHIFINTLYINPEDKPEHIELLCQVNIKHLSFLRIRSPPTAKCVDYLQQIHTLSKLKIEPPIAVSSRSCPISEGIMNDLVPHSQNRLIILTKPQLTKEPTSSTYSITTPINEDDLKDLIYHFNNIIRILFERRVVVIGPSSYSSFSSFIIGENNKNAFRQHMQIKRDYYKEQNMTFEPCSSSSRPSPECERYIYSLIENIQNDVDKATEQESTTATSISSSSSISRSSNISEDNLYNLIQNNSHTLKTLNIWHITFRSKTKLSNLLNNLLHLKRLYMFNISLPKQLLCSLQDLKRQRPYVYIGITNPQILPDTKCTE